MSVSEDTETAFTESAIISNTKVICNLPTIAKKVFTTYHLALSFDGEMYSEETMVSVFDSVCIDCTVDGVCMIKVGFTEILIKLLLSQFVHFINQVCHLF